ncbi:E3 ubiquitin-protein ligase TRIM71-like [Saccostrea cucullata]|uniref:E3 ubiquitin-protein ligase TRIM71-like n=1 Tax=Saccostrea cuccullata TaxID=36930 RepID=UPI002ED3A198
MASASSSWAQHCLECDNCEVRAAQYLCKSCQGRLCKDCKLEHKQRRLTKDHVIVSLSADHGTKILYPYCPDHDENRLEYYCSVCKTPVCTMCMTDKHNGHTVREIEEVYKEIREVLQREREEIENIVLPAYNKQVSEEEDRKNNVSMRAREVENQIEAHAAAIIERVTNTKEKAIGSIREDESKVLKLIYESKEQLRRKTESLNLLHKELCEKLSSDPDMEYFTKEDTGHLEVLRHISPTYSYSIEDFHPGQIENIFNEKEFGSAPCFEYQSPLRDLMKPISRICNKNFIEKLLKKSNR